MPRAWRWDGGSRLAIVVVGVVLAVLTWPVGSMQAPYGMDGAWMVALQMAVHDGVNFGSDLLFTYGPLGFLRQPLYIYPWLARLSWAYTLVLHLALVLTFVWLLRRRTGSLALAAIGAVLLAGVVRQEPVLTLAFLWSAALVEGPPGPARGALLAAALGVLAGTEVLVKLNTGVIALVMALLTLAFAPPGDRRIRALALGGGAVAALCLGWLLTGQSVADAVDYVRGGLGIISGYSEAMGQADPALAWQKWAAAVVFATGLLALWRWRPDLGRRRRLELSALWLLFAFAAAKASFVRHDGAHGSIVLEALCGGLIIFPRPQFRVAAALVGLLALTSVYASRSTDPLREFRPVAYVKALGDQVGTLTDGSATNAQIAAGREDLARRYAVDPAAVDELRGHTVHIDPQDASIAWALGLDWKPIPIFQAYSAYTSDLDRRNADALAAPDGPERILRVRVPPFDGRNVAWESPAAVRAMLCHYRPLPPHPNHLVLERTANRCGQPRRIGTARGRYGEELPVPPAAGDDTLVYAELDGPQVRGLERLRTLFGRAADRNLRIDGQEARRYRLVPGTAGDGLLLQVPEAIDHPAPFRLDQSAHTIAVLDPTRQAQPDREVTVRYYAVRMR